jgi:hypothetical protein
MASNPAQKLLLLSAQLWFLVAMVGQVIFALYVALNYGAPALHQSMAEANKTLPHGFESGNAMGNLMVGLHLFFAVVITLGGPLQLIPKLRSAAPRFHHWNGRIYLTTAVIMALSGLYLSYSGRRGVGDVTQHMAITVNAVLILVTAVLTVRTAIARRFAEHRKWALRLYLMVSGVWFFRVGLMFWLVVNRAPVGFNMKTFSGPFLTILAWLVYAGTLGFLEVYLRAYDSPRPAVKVAAAIMVACTTIVMAVGIFAATMGMWIPRIR